MYVISHFDQARVDAEHAHRFGVAISNSFILALLNLPTEEVYIHTLVILRHRSHPARKPVVLERAKGQHISRRNDPDIASINRIREELQHAAQILARAAADSDPVRRDGMIGAVEGRIPHRDGLAQRRGSLLGAIE